MEPLRLEDFDISPERGMLADPDPDRQPLPAAFHVWEAMAQEIRKLLITSHTRTMIEAMQLLDADYLADKHLPAAMRLLSFLGHASVCADPKHPTDWIPKSVAVPWHHVATRLGRPPILSYASYALDN